MEGCSSGSIGSALGGPRWNYYSAEPYRDNAIGTGLLGVPRGDLVAMTNLPGLRGADRENKQRTTGLSDSAPVAMARKLGPFPDKTV